MSGLDDMIKRIELMNSPEYKRDMNKLVKQMIDFIAKYRIKGIMGFYKGEKFTFSILPNEESVEMHINNPVNQ